MSFVVEFGPVASDNPERRACALTHREFDAFEFHGDMGRVSRSEIKHPFSQAPDCRWGKALFHSDRFPRRYRRKFVAEREIRRRERAQRDDLLCFVVDQSTTCPGLLEEFERHADRALELFVSVKLTSMRAWSKMHFSLSRHVAVAERTCGRAADTVVIAIITMNAKTSLG